MDLDHMINDLHRLTGWLAIHDWSIFIIVLAIGIGQTILAVYGGYLSALTLDPAPQRKHYQKLKSIGLFIIALTLILGYLNDKSQFSSQTEAVEARTNLATVRHPLKNCD